MADDDDHRVIWKSRLVDAVIGRKFDDETLIDMLVAGFSEAHCEGIEDAAETCEFIHERTGERVADVLGRNFRKLAAADRRQIELSHPSLYDLDPQQHRSQEQNDAGSGSDLGHGFADHGGNSG